jgi:hypothetical protein
MIRSVRFLGILVVVFSVAAATLSRLSPSPPTGTAVSPQPAPTPVRRASAASTANSHRINARRRSCRRGGSLPKEGRAVGEGQRLVRAQPAERAGRDEESPDTA